MPEPENDVIDLGETRQLRGAVGRSGTAGGKTVGRAIRLVGYGGGRKGPYGTAGVGLPSSLSSASRRQVDDAAGSRKAGVFGMRWRGSLEVPPPVAYSETERVAGFRMRAVNSDPGITLITAGR